MIAGGGRREAVGGPSRRRRYGRIILVFLILGVVGVTVWFAVHAFSNPSEPAVPDDARAPEGVRIKVEVLNATRTRGLARKATDFLRDRGFDVVGSGNDTEPRAKTVVYDRSSHPEWARLVGLAMKAPVVSRPDSSRYLDVTVLIGADWRPPPLPFHP
ncbi:MAG TPA: LytR C-terminal domain-containing protein [Gemmatimonadaceae bacterium]|nr:LytR C-terminal domain-containing protein [Gemmatimonadaceae bacterium]